MGHNDYFMRLDCDCGDFIFYLIREIWSIKKVTMTIFTFGPKKDSPNWKTGNDYNSYRSGFLLTLLIK